MKAQLPEDPTLPQIQQYLKEICKERGWDKNTDLEIFLLLSEEMGELAKAIRNQRGLYAEADKAQRWSLEEEFADVFNYLLDLANYFDVDLYEAFRKKDAHNAERNWKSQK